MKKFLVGIVVAAVATTLFHWLASPCNVAGENVGADGRTAHTERLVDVTITVHTDPPMSFVDTWNLVENTYENEICTSICRQLSGKVEFGDVHYHFPETKLK